MPLIPSGPAPSPSPPRLQLLPIVILTLRMHGGPRREGPF
jgi:hypothetical protein